MDNIETSSAQASGKYTWLAFFLIAGITGYFFFAGFAIPREQAYLRENQEKLFANHFASLNEVLDSYIENGLSDEERKHIAENWTNDTRTVSDLDFTNTAQFSHEVTKLQQRDFYIQLMQDDEALVREEAAKLKKYVQDGVSVWSGPYGIDIETEYGMESRIKYLAILRYGTERISPLFELNPTISNNSRDYGDDRTRVLRLYYGKHALVLLPALAIIYFLVRLLSGFWIKIFGKGTVS